MGDPAAGPGQFAVIVNFELADGSQRAFLDLVTENARASRRIEPECLQFDVLVPEDDADGVVLYEIYTSAAAFTHHLSLPHFKAFDTASRPHVTHKSVRRLGVATRP